MQDSRVTRGKTNCNRFALEFHPRGISSSNPSGLTPAENDGVGGGGMQSFLDRFLVSSRSNAPGSGEHFRGASVLVRPLRCTFFRLSRY